MTIRIGKTRGEVECDFCAKVKKIDPSDFGLDTMDDVIEGEFIRVSPDDQYARHACTNCIREGLANITANGNNTLDPERATAIFNAFTKSLQENSDIDFMKDIADAAIENLPDANFDDAPAAPPEKKPSEQPLSRTTPLGSVVALTGPFRRGKRHEVEELLQRAGYHVRSSVADRTKAVILGAHAYTGFMSGKIRAARNKNIRVIGEDVFFAANVENKQLPPPPLSDGAKAKLEAQRRKEERAMLQRQLADEERLKRQREASLEVAKDNLREVLKDEVSFDL